MHSFSSFFPPHSIPLSLCFFPLSSAYVKIELSCYANVEFILWILGFLPVRATRGPAGYLLVWNHSFLLPDSSTELRSDRNLNFSKRSNKHFPFPCFVSICILKIKKYIYILLFLAINLRQSGQAYCFSRKNKNFNFSSRSNLYWKKSRLNQN